MHPVEIVGSRVTIREFRVADVDRVVSIIGDDRVTNSLSFDARDKRQAESMITGVMERARSEPRTEYYLAIDAPELVGFVRLGLSGIRAAKLGYAVRADEWRKGYASEAARLMLNFAFANLGLHRVSAAVGPLNEASIALSKKLGFTQEGTLRDHVYTNGAWRNSILFSVLADEWTTNNESAR